MSAFLIPPGSYAVVPHQLDTVIVVKRTFEGKDIIYTVWRPGRNEAYDVREDFVVEVGWLTWRYIRWVNGRAAKRLRAARERAAEAHNEVQEWEAKVRATLARRVRP